MERRRCADVATTFRAAASKSGVAAQKIRFGDCAPDYPQCVMPVRKAERDDIDRIGDRPFSKDPSRVVAISDGVFAVALTLLILDVKPPTVSQALLASAIIATAPRLGIFALSFAKCWTGWVTSGACSSSPCSKRGSREPGFQS